MNRGLTSTGRQGYRRNALWILAFFVGVLAVMAAINTRVNPVWVTPAPWSSADYDHYKPLYRALRTGKAGIAAQGDWQAALLGSSRVDIAMDPLLPQWQGQRVANLALRSGVLTESYAMLKYAAQYQDLELALVGLDLGDITTPTRLIPGVDFYDSPLVADNRIEREFRYVCGVSTFHLSLKAMRYRWRGTLSAYSPEGHWVRDQNRGPFRHQLQYGSFIGARRSIRTRRKEIVVNEEKVAALRSILQLCRERSIRLILFIPPNHAAFLTTYRLAAAPDVENRLDRELFCRLLAEDAAAHPAESAVVLWDFNDFHPLNCEPLPPLDEDGELQYWIDGTHALPSLGEIMLERMLGWELTDDSGRDYGVPLSMENLEQRIQALDEGYRRYQRDNPEDVEWIRETLGQVR